MINVAFLHVVQEQLRNGEGALGFCIVFVGLIWGTLTGGLLVDELIEQLLVVTACTLGAALLFVLREFVLARASLVHAPS